MSIVIEARDFRLHDSETIISTIDVALRVLKQRKLRKSEKKYLSVLLKDIVEILAD